MGLITVPSSGAVSTAVVIGIGEMSRVGYGERENVNVEWPCCVHKHNVRHNDREASVAEFDSTQLYLVQPCI